MKVMACLWVLLSSALVIPELAAPPKNGPIIAATGAFFALSVADILASAKWYSETLGLAVVKEEPKHEGATVIVLEGRGLIVELIQHDAAVPLGTAAPGVKSSMLVHGIVKAGIIVADLDETLAALRRKNVQIAFGPYPARADQRANVIIRDNAGNLIQLFGS